MAPGVQLQSLALLLLSHLAAGNLLCGPGCTSCPLLGFGCTACGVGYTLLGSRCGCAAGYGSYASPAVAGFQSAAPTCLLAAAAAADGAADADAATAAAAVEPSLLFGGRCSCVLCPPGYSSIGGSISSAVCVPVANPSQKCRGQPPRAANARPFGPNCRDGMVGRTCRAACNAGFTGQIQAVCTATAGWQVTGTCNAPAAGACAGTPSAPTGQGRTWPALCAGAATNYLCKGSEACPSGQGSVAAWSVCQPSGLWSTPEVGLCPGVSSASCNVTPPAVANNQFTCGTSQPAGFICAGQCDTGYAGQLLVKCNANGSWDAPSGSNCTIARCSGLPPIGANGGNWPSGCAGYQYNQQCITGCASGFSGQVSSTCQASGVWAPPVSSCAPSGTAATAGLRCSGPPPAVPGVTWGAACANSASQFVCTGSCASGGTLVTSTCTGNGGWSQPQGSCP